MNFPEKLNQKILNRHATNSFRELGQPSDLIDFSSNDYLGFAQSKTIYKQTQAYLESENLQCNGSTGSRLLTGNHKLYDQVEQQLSDFHQAESALIFNSGYDANLGFFSSVPQRGDLIFYDELIHASIRDGLKMSPAKHYKFAHNDLEDLELQLERQKKQSPSESESCVYIVTESVFSMDGDSPDLKQLIEISQKHKAYLVIDEAHAVGVLGQDGRGLINKLQLQNDVFARIITFGKALGCHGAAILGSKELRDYLVNFSRPFIYTTALAPHSLASIKISYDSLQKLNQNDTSALRKLQNTIQFFKNELIRFELRQRFIHSDSAIHCCLISGNDHVKSLAEHLHTSGFNVKAILSPTVPEGKERLRFCLHAYNTEKEISNVLTLLSTFVNKS